MASTEGVCQELGILALHAHDKRKCLFESSHRRRRFRNVLRIASGVMALLSGTAATAIFTELTSAAGMKILSATLIFVSGLISIFLDAIANPKDIEQMYSGAS